MSILRCDVGEKVTSSLRAIITPTDPEKRERESCFLVGIQVVSISSSLSFSMFACINSHGATSSFSIPSSTVQPREDSTWYGRLLDWRPTQQPESGRTDEVQRFASIQVTSERMYCWRPWDVSLFESRECPKSTNEGLNLIWTVSWLKSDIHPEAEDPVVSCVTGYWWGFGYQMELLEICICVERMYGDAGWMRWFF